MAMDSGIDATERREGFLKPHDVEDFAVLASNAMEAATLTEPVFVMKRQAALVLRRYVCEEVSGPSFAGLGFKALKKRSAQSLPCVS